MKKNGICEAKRDWRVSRIGENRLQVAEWEMGIKYWRTTRALSLFYARIMPRNQVFISSIRSALYKDTS